MRKANNSTRLNSSITKLTGLALSLSLISSTCLPSLAVLSAPPATSKSKTDKAKEKDSKKEAETKPEKKEAKTEEPDKSSTEANKSKDEPASQNKEAETQAKDDSKESVEPEQTEKAKDNKKEEPKVEAKQKQLKLDIVEPVPESEDTPIAIPDSKADSAKEKDSSTENQEKVESKLEKKKADSSESKTTEFGYDDQSTGKAQEENEASNTTANEPLEVEQSFETSSESTDTDSKNDDTSTSDAMLEEDTSEETAEEPVEEVKKPKHIAEADSYLLKNKFEKAEKAYRLLLDEDENGDAYAGLAVALAKQSNAKKVIEAEEILKKGKEDFPDNPNMMAAAGFVAFKHSKNVASPAKRDRYVEASEQLCDMAIAANPDIVIAQQTLGLVKLFQDEPEEAIPPFKICYEITEDETNATLLAKALLKINPKDRQAKSLIEEALEINPEYSPAVLQKAIYLTNTGKHEEAFTELHSIPRPERESEWYQVQGDIYKKQGDGNSSVTSWKESMRRNPRSPDPYKRLAEHYTMRGDGELAIAEMHSALEILPNDIRLRQKLAELALRMDKLEVAEQEFRTILSVKTDDPSAVLGLARVFFRKARREGQYPQGWIELKDKLQDVIMKQSLSVTGSRYKAEAANFREKIQLTEAEKALTQKQFRDARRLFRNIINKHQNNPFQLLTLAEQAYNDGDLKSAELAYSYAREIPEVAPRAEQGISKITSQRKEAKRQIKLGDATERKLPDVAEDHYKQALIADPQDADAFYNLFILYVKERKDQIEKALDFGNGFLEASEDTDGRRQQVEKILFKLKDRLRKIRSK